MDQRYYLFKGIKNKLMEDEWNKNDIDYDLFFEIESMKSAYTWTYGVFTVFWRKG